MQQHTEFLRARTKIRGWKAAARAGEARAGAEGNTWFLFLVFSWLEGEKKLSVESRPATPRPSAVRDLQPPKLTAEIKSKPENEREETSNQR